MSKYEELKYVLSGATDWGYEYAKKEDVKAAFDELEERHAMDALFIAIVGGIWIW